MHFAILSQSCKGLCFLLSGDQTLLRLPPAAEAPLPPHRSATAAGLHAGRAQAQSLHLLAQHWQTGSIQEVKTELEKKAKAAEGGCRGREELSARA